MASLAPWLVGFHRRGVVLWLHLPRLDWRVWFLPLGARRDAIPDVANQETNSEQPTSFFSGQNG